MMQTVLICTIAYLVAGIVIAAAFSKVSTDGGGIGSKAFLVPLWLPIMLVIALSPSALLARAKKLASKDKKEKDDE